MNYRQYQPELEHLRRRFHQIPELGLEEKKTTAMICSYLQAYGYEVRMLAPTGCTALFMVDPACKTLIIRAEIDGIPMKEMTGLSYASLHEGIMHACCHDANMAEALVLARILMEQRDQGINPRVNVRFVFEPAEEIGMGAKLMIDQGVLDKPKADYFLMFHFAGHREWEMEINHYHASAAIRRFEIKIRGHAVHWSIRERGRDALHVAGRLAVWLGDMNDQGLVPNPYCVGTGVFHAGTSSNTMAQDAELAGGVRCYSLEELDTIRLMINEKASELAHETGTDIQVVWKEDTVLPIVNDRDMVAQADKVAFDVFGEAYHPIDYLYLAGDNAFRYFSHCKGIFMVFAYKNPVPEYGLHNPRMVMDDSRMYQALEMLHRYLLALE